MHWDDFINQALREDIGEGDHTSLSCIPPSAQGKALLRVKGDGIIAGTGLARKIFHHLDHSSVFTPFIADGQSVKAGDVAFEISGNAQAILAGERLSLNCMQRMSGIATLTHQFVSAVNGFPVKILDTRKTTPLFRAAEKWAVRIGGGFNHRSGLFDAILIKDNHIDFAGGIVQAITRVKNYLVEKNLSLPVEVEARTLEDVKVILETGGIDRIMFDNFQLNDLREGVGRVNHTLETEASGGVSLETVRDIAATGVDFISVGALTHSYRSIDLSLKAEIH